MEQKPKKRSIKFSMYWMYVFVGLFIIGMWFLDDNSITKEVSYSDFEKQVLDGGVERIVVFTNKNQAEAYLNDSVASTIFHKSQFTQDTGQEAKILTDIPSADKLQDKIEQWKAEGVFNGDVKFEKGNDFSALLWSFGPIILIIAFWIFAFRRMSNKDGAGGGVFSVGKSKAKIFDKDGPIRGHTDWEARFLRARCS